MSLIFYRDPNFGVFTGSQLRKLRKGLGRLLGKAQYASNQRFPPRRRAFLLPCSCKKDGERSYERGCLCLLPTPSPLLAADFDPLSLLIRFHWACDNLFAFFSVGAMLYLTLDQFVTDQDSGKEANTLVCSDWQLELYFVDRADNFTAPD